MFKIYILHRDILFCLKTLYFMDKILKQKIYYLLPLFILFPVLLFFSLVYAMKKSAILV